MRLFSWLKSKTSADPDRRSNLANPDRWLVDFFAGTESKSGMRVNPDSALEWVFDAVQVRAQTVAGLPLKLFRNLENGDKEPATNHPLYRVVHDQPHPDLTSFEWRNMMNSHLDLRGNAYAQIVRDAGGRVRRLVPLHPDRVTVRRSREITSDGLRPLIYQVTNAGFGTTSDGLDATVNLSAFEVLHVRGYTTDGVCGVSPLRLKSETIGIGMAANEHAARMFSNGAKPAGVLEHPAKLSEAGAKNLRDSWTAAHGGVGNSSRVAILEDGMKFNEIGLTNVAAQLLESRRYSRTEIASMYRVPPHMLGDLERATFSNIEQQSIEFVVHCILPIVTNWEQRMNSALLTEDEQAEYFFKFNVAGLLRGDLASRYNAYRVGLGRAGEPGWITINDIRSSEDMNLMDGGDTLFTGLAPATATAGTTARDAVAPLLTDALGRAFRKEAKAVRALSKKPDATAEIEKFYGEHRRYLLETLTPVFIAARALSLEIGDAETLADATIKESHADTSENALTSWETTRAAKTANLFLPP